MNLAGFFQQLLIYCT